MRQFIFLLAFSSFMLATTLVNAQRKSAVFLEFLGSGVFYSINFDRRLSDMEKGWGINAGFEFIPTGSNKLEGNFTGIFLKANHLLGKATHFLELSAGPVYLGGNADFLGDYQYKKSLGISAGAMYRLQTKRGFLLRAGLSLTKTKAIYTVLPGLSLGYAF